MKLAEQISKWEESIRLGRGNEVATAIGKLKIAKIPSQNRIAVANLCRRVGEYGFGLKLLQSQFLAARKAPLQNEALIAEYAALLTEIGATSISERLLSQYKNPKYEMIPFYRALLWMKKWEYDRVPEEIALFKTLSKDPYRLHVADVNLVSALIVLKRFDEASALLNSLKEKTSSATPMLAGIISEQEGELLFFTGERRLARRHFAAAIEKLQASKNPSGFFAEKWLAIIDLNERPWSEIEKRWFDFAKRMEKKGYWEILREMDRYFAIRFERTDIFNKLYFGSPLESYRRLISAEVKLSPELNFSYPQNAKNYFDISSFQLVISEKVIAVPPMYRKMLLALSRDLYKPVAVGSLFEALYPGEYYQPEFAATRVYRLIARLREFAKKHKLSLKIEASELGFRLDCGRNFCVRYSQGEPAEATLNFIGIVAKNFSNRAFTATELMQISGMPKRSINRALSNELESGTIRAIGKGKNIKYSLLP
jgi:hypothetical protein